MEKYTQNEVLLQVKKVCGSLQLSLHHNWIGPKIYSQHQMIALLTLKARENKSLRRFVAWLYETKWPEVLGLKAIPSYSSIYRAMKRLGMNVLRKINFAIISTLRSSIKGIDGSGFQMQHRSRHYEKRANLEYLPNGKLDIVGDLTYFLIDDWHFAVKERHDVLAAKRMMKRSEHVANIDLWADKGYDCEELHELSFAKGFNLLAPTRRSTRKRPKGRFRRIVDEKIKSKPKYERAKVETIFSILKRVYGETIRSQKPHMKKREMAWKIIALNIEKVLMHLFYWLFFKPFETEPIE